MKKRFTALLPNPAASLKKFAHIKLSIFMTILKYANLLGKISLLIIVKRI
jgi:hypothetical protein